MPEVYFGEIQSGHLEQVGYDTYCRLLDEVVKEMQGIEVEKEQDIQIDMNISSYIPEEYIENSSQKIEVYQDIAISKTEEDLKDVLDELIDRYGGIPEEVHNLIEIARIKQLCKLANIIKIMQRREMIVFYFDTSKFSPQIVDKIVKLYNNKIKFSPGKDSYITLKLESNSNKVIIEEVKKFLKECVVSKPIVD